MVPTQAVKKGLRLLIYLRFRSLLAERRAKSSSEAVLGQLL